MVNRVMLIANFLGHKLMAGNDVQKIRPDIFYLFIIFLKIKLRTAKK